MTTAVLVAAAGFGTRLGPGAPKALRPLRGELLLVHAVRALVDAPSVGRIVVAAPPDEVELVQSVLAPIVGPRVRLTVVAGGADRVESVARALDVLVETAPEVDVVLVHDAARALVPPELVERVAQAVRAGAPAVIPIVGLADTVKQLASDGSVAATLDRSVLCGVQTPQGFDVAVLVAAHRAERDRTAGIAVSGSGQVSGGGPVATDDAALVEWIGVPVQTVPGSDEAFKVTTPLDLMLAEAVLERRHERGRS